MLGDMSFEACLAECERYDCGAVQHDCGTGCWLLKSCSNELDGIRG